MKRWIGCSSLGLARAAVLVLALTVLSPAVAESQILVICGIYRDSYADTGANLCHGNGPGCAECVFIALAQNDDGEPVDPPRQSVTLASYTPRLIERAEELDQLLTLAVSTGLPFAPPGQSGCNAPASSTACERLAGSAPYRQRRIALPTDYSQRYRRVDAGPFRWLRRLGHRPGAVGDRSGARSLAAGAGRAPIFEFAGRDRSDGRCSVAS